MALWKPNGPDKTLLFAQPIQHSPCRLRRSKIGSPLGHGRGCRRAGEKQGRYSVGQGQGFGQRLWRDDVTEVDPAGRGSTGPFARNMKILVDIASVDRTLSLRSARRTLTSTAPALWRSPGVRRSRKWRRCCSLKRLVWRRYVIVRKTTNSRLIANQGSSCQTIMPELVLLLN